MNNIVLIGNLTRDPEYKVLPNGETTVISFSIAVQRDFKKDEADFINIKNFAKSLKQIEFYETVLRKGKKVGVVGRIQTGSYEKEGKRIYTTDVIADKLEFLDSKGNKEVKQDHSQKDSNAGLPDGFEEVSEDNDLIPF